MKINYEVEFASHIRKEEAQESNIFQNLILTGFYLEITNLSVMRIVLEIHGT